MKREARFLDTREDERMRRLAARGQTMITGWIVEGLHPGELIFLLASTTIFLLQVMSEEGEPLMDEATQMRLGKELAERIGDYPWLGETPITMLQTAAMLMNIAGATVMAEGGLMPGVPATEEAP